MQRLICAVRGHKWESQFWAEKPEQKDSEYPPRLRLYIMSCLRCPARSYRIERVIGDTWHCYKGD